MSLYSDFQPAPPDSILGLSAAFAKDPRPGKINLGVGVYKDATGKTPILDCVKRAEERLWQTENSKTYLPIDGDARYGAAVRELLFGKQHSILRDNRAQTAQSPGGTGALRLAADFIARNLPGRTIWVSDPTWANHPAIFSAAGLALHRYPYYNAETHQLDREAFFAGLETIPEGDVVVLHACCHNPTGVDLTKEDWHRVVEILQKRNLLPLLDFAYQGFGDGLAEDAVGLHELTKKIPELFIASSFSKNFGLYGERVGALTIVAESEKSAELAMGHLRLRIRTNYSNPPLHGAAIVRTTLADAELRSEWETELTAMRERIASMRQLFVDTLRDRGVRRDFSFLTQQKGMFSYSGLNEKQVNLLREQYAIFIVGDGRINVAGMSESNMDYLCEAISSVL